MDTEPAGEVGIAFAMQRVASGPGRISRAPRRRRRVSPRLLLGPLMLALICLSAGALSAPVFADVGIALPFSTIAVPALSVQGDTVQWSPVGLESVYELAISNDVRGASDRTTRYLWSERTSGQVQSYTPTLSPNETVYVGISADGGTTWSEEATVTAPTPPPQPEPVINPSAPVLSVHGYTIQWSPVPGATSYELATILNPATTRVTTYQVLSSTSITPPVAPGQTVSYGLAANTPSAQGPWASEVSISYPLSPVGEPPVSPPVSLSKIIGTNDGAGWGTAAAKTILAGHITWNRVEIGMESNTLAASLSDGFRVLAIVGNVNDSTPLSQDDPNTWAATVVSQLKTNPGIAIAEAGNEMYLKGNVANPIQYGRMYLAAVNAMKAAGIHTPLLFNMLGDYHLGTWSSPTGYSNDANGGGWLHDAVAGVPGLASAILANGLSTHPYGALNENHNDTNGVDAVPAQEAVAKNVLGAIPPIYITEFGYSLNNCGQNDGACSEAEQATKMRSAYQALLADPHVAGIWWYQSHDDSTGHFGYINNNNTTRPAYTTLAEIATEQGQ